MRGVDSRVGTNLGWMILIGSVIVVAASVRWMGGAFFGDAYEVSVSLPEAGGVLPGQPVTVLGVPVGTVKDSELTDTGVDFRLQIEGSEQVPASGLVQVLRRSPIGEQAIEVTPVVADWEPPKDEPIVASRVPVAEDWTPAEPGATIETRAVVTPSSVPALLEKAETFLMAMDGDDLDTVITELATGVEGRVELLRKLNRDSADLTATFVEGIPEFQRLIDSSGPLLSTLQEQTDTLAAAIRDTADVSETLASARPDLEKLLEQAAPTLRRADVLIRNQRPNMHCLNSDLLALNRMTLQPENLDDLKMLLDLNRYFYGSFDAGTQWDPYRPGVIWARVNILMMEEAGGQPYEPRRATPPTLPGGACESPFGFGVNAVRQDDPPPVPPDPTSPGIQYAPLQDGAGPASQRGESDGG